MGYEFYGADKIRLSKALKIFPPTLYGTISQRHGRIDRRYNRLNVTPLTEASEQPILDSDTAQYLSQIRHEQAERFGRSQAHGLAVGELAMIGFDLRLGWK